MPPIGTFLAAAFPTAPWLSTATNFLIGTGLSDKERQDLLMPLTCGLEFATLTEAERALRVADAEQLITRMGAFLSTASQLADDVENLVLPLPATEAAKKTKTQDFKANVDVYQKTLITKPADRPSDIQLELATRLGAERRIVSRVKEQISNYEQLMESLITWHDRLPTLLALHKKFVCTADGKVRTSETADVESDLTKSVQSVRDARAQHRIVFRVVAESN